MSAVRLASRGALVFTEMAPALDLDSETAAGQYGSGPLDDAGTAPRGLGDGGDCEPRVAASGAISGVGHDAHDSEYRCCRGVRLPA